MEVYGGKFYFSQNLEFLKIFDFKFFHKIFILFFHFWHKICITDNLAQIFNLLTKIDLNQENNIFQK